MSFGFGGFGQNNQSTGFGAGSGFGGTSSGGGFGSGTPNQSNSLFGNQNRTGGFGTGAGAGTTSGGSLFGGGTGGTPTGAGFGGFGSTGNTANTTNTGGFGSSNNATGGGLFGNKTAGTGFGSSTGTTGGFGTSGGGFGSGTTGFGSGTGTAFQQAVPPSEGTGSTPFSPFTEKDGSTNVTNHYQSISFMQPYSKYCFEELRLGDYQQGRRFGNGSGQAGAFGTSAFGGSGFGQQQQQQSTGFGSTSSPFGGTSAPSAFGQTQTTGGFGSTSTTSNPLFGAKPATSLFGGGTSTGTSQPGLFGGTTATSGGFGSTANTGTGTGFGSGGSLFGNNNTTQQAQQQQNKPLFGGNTSAGTGGFGGFGQQNTSTSTPFGGTAATSSPFGGGQQQQTGGGAFGGFGQQNQQNQTQTQNKGLFGGGGGFGQNTQQQQSSTPSLFGGGTGTTGGSSLFGQNSQQQQSTGGSLFGGNNQQSGSGSLFGGNTQQQGQKSLFGSGTTAPGTATGAFGGFGNTQNQQTGTGGLFGNTQNQQQQKPGGLFGGSTATGGSLFGGSTAAAQNTGSSLFGNTQGQQQQQSGGLGLGTSSLFGNTQQAQSQQQQPQQPVPGSLQASLLDPNPYGNQSIFSGLPAPSAPSPGPLATPLSSSIKQKQRTPLPVYKITPNAANRLVTPPKRQGYGFSYSTYASPSSSAGTPGGLGGSLLGGSLRGSVNGSLGRASFSKSFSTSNLRKSFDPETDSVLSPGALSSGSSRLSSGNLKRLTIDRSLRNDLFSRPASTPAATITNGEDTAQPTDRTKKKVSFEATSDSTTGSEIVPVQCQTPEPTPEELGFLRSIRKSNTINGINGLKENGTRPEMESIREKDLPAVPEDFEQTATTDGISRLAFVPGGDPQPGEYWMKPTRAELNKLSRDQLKHVVGFTVGRQRCGQVTFNEPVDLTNIDLDQIFGGLVDIGVRKITVYPDEAIKPPRGKGLNVPSILRIENSWPRGRDKKSPSPLTSGPLFEKHVDRLRKVHNTDFIDYETETGTWVFKVPHYTTYGLDYDSDDDEGESLNQSTLSAAPDTPTPKAHTPTNLDNTVASEQMSTFSTDDSFLGSVAGVDDDTFDFKKRKLVPGSFGNQAMEIMEDEHSNFGEDEESFLGEGSTGSTTEQEGDDVTECQQSGESEVELDEDEEMDMAGTFPSLHHTVERDDTKSTGSYENTRPSLRPWGTPPKARLDLSGDWAEQLQRTISPRKQNRDALREIQANAFIDRPLHEDDTEEPVADTRQKGFATSIDLMNSLFQQPQKHPTQSPSKPRNVQPKGFEWPYNKKPKTFASDSNELSQDDLAFHHSFKPRWGPADSILCVKDGMGGVHSGDHRWEQKFSITSEERDIILLALNKAPDLNVMLDAQKKQTIISCVDDVPFARLAKADFQQFAQTSSSMAGSDQERLLWQLANILFNDDIEDDISAGVPPQLRAKFIHRIKKDRLSRLWEGVVRERHAHTLGKADSAEEQAIFLLCSHRVEEACNVLIASQNLHLATLIAQIGRDPTSRCDMAKQIEMWRQHNVYSEMTEPIRALYELLAGNALRSEGKSGGALEDRVSTFTLTERFGLDWIQAFGLRLWYGITDDEPIEAAVCKFLNDLNTGDEPAFPYPFHKESARETSHAVSDTLGQESPLWVLLKVYSMTLGAAKDIPAIDFPAALLPESVSGDKLSNRLSFQLYQLLTAAVGRHDGFKVDTFHVDQLVWDYAWELSCGDQLDRALFVLLHLSQAEDRERALKETIARFAARLPDQVNSEGAPDTTWQHLTRDLQIPEAWIWVAKALSARDAGDAPREVDCLVRGKNWNDAHATFCRIVGPTAVIERDYATLETLLSGFGDAPDRKVQGWANGGGVYEDFLRLATAKSGKRDATRLNRLVNALVAMGTQISQGSGVEGLEERVAFKEMSRAIASWTAHEDGKAVEFSGVLSLPLTGEARIMQTAEMSRRYYNVIMAGAY
ncbi:nuclear protein 96-domain-containing protein [Aspergillus alliaceus]|uniref:Nuclear protein 96-domain-containing protein n=1 Tax=Petromyces alliaceus TaxID=209559 RepID=A0A5N7CD42_PETAA|nr:nuclear protein 96-domain-containing protein [Aspergillus alliaceus]